MTAQATVNGITLKQMASFMLRMERIINFYNKKYSFEIERGTAQEQKEYRMAQSGWDTAKAHRDRMKSAA